MTAREVEVLALAPQGHGRLVLSAKTVGNHIEHIYMKIGCSSHAEASLFAMQQGCSASYGPLKDRANAS